MNELLTINKPRIEKEKLISTIEYENKKYDLFFKVEKDYSKYLCEDNANAFLVALLPFIVKHNYDVDIKSNISSKLYYQVSTYLLPMLCNEFKKDTISIKCSLTDKKYDSQANGASISCGIDSFYTLLKHKNCMDKNYNITHLCFFNAGSNGEFGGDAAQKRFKERVAHIRKFCKTYNYPLVTIDSNMNELIMMNHEKRHTFTTLSCVYSLEKLFKNYYFASGFGFNGSHITEEDTAYYDILNVHCLSDENINFYCSGIETTRMEKVKYISNFEMTYNWLNVCVDSDWENCGHCIKCVRTLTALDSINKLNKYKNSFDIEHFCQNRNKILANLLISSRDKIQRDFCNEIITSYSENKIKIPLIAYLLSYLPTISNLKMLVKNFLPKRIFNYLKRKVKSDKLNDGWTD